MNKKIFLMAWQLLYAGCLAAETPKSIRSFGVLPQKNAATNARILHCYLNPANQRFTAGGYSRAVADAVMAKKTFAINNTHHARLMDVFTFNTYGGILAHRQVLAAFFLKAIKN